MEYGTFAVLCFILTLSPLGQNGKVCSHGRLVVGFWQLMLYTDITVSKIRGFFPFLKWSVLSFFCFMVNADYICS